MDDHFNDCSMNSVHTYPKTTFKKSLLSLIIHWQYLSLSNLFTMTTQQVGSIDLKIRFSKQHLQLICFPPTMYI